MVFHLVYQSQTAFVLLITCVIRCCCRSNTSKNEVMCLMLVILKSYGTYCKVPSCLMFTSPSHTWKRVFVHCPLGSNASPYPSCHCFAVYTLVPNCIVFKDCMSSWQDLNQCFSGPQCRFTRTYVLPGLSCNNCLYYYLPYYQKKGLKSESKKNPTTHQREVKCVIGL